MIHTLAARATRHGDTSSCTPNIENVAGDGAHGVCLEDERRDEKHDACLVESHSACKIVCEGWQVSEV
jgi:hypothetical protein